ncbi:hypothetical protein GGI11_007935 [Coemansia sp. RSA 2049]|nr:hypothetical protein GGI11_007935 [Coemansia sp. RSA 2049]
MKLATILATFAATAASVAASTPSLVYRTVSSGTVDWADANVKGKTVNGDFTFRPDSDGGLTLYVSASGLTKGAKYPFHIHTNFVPTNGNCTGTLGHLNPYNINTTTGVYKCDPSNIQTTCEIGDLSGIFGSMVGDADGKFDAKFDATLLSFSGKTSILDRSVVIHNSAGDRVACGNITAYVLDDGDNDNSDSEGKSGTESDHTSEASMFAPLFSGILAVAVAALVF